MRSSAGTSSPAERLLLLLFLCLPSMGGAAEPSLEEKVRVEPAAFQLWKDRSAQLTLASETDVDEVQFSASLGQVDGVQRSSPREFTAVWHPPQEGYPQVAILVAHVRRGEAWSAGFVALPLAGLGDAVVHATPRSRISVRIGERNFGPVQTDSTGLARVPVEVPPGERNAWQGDKAIPLGVPESKRIHATAAMDSARSDRISTVPVHLFAVDPFGVPIGGARFSLTADQGEVGPVTQLSFGHYVVNWRVSPLVDRPAHLKVSLTGAPGFESVVELKGRLGPPNAISLSLGQKELRAEQPELRGQARVVDAKGELVNAPLELKSSLCEHATVEQSAVGVYEWKCAVRPNFGGQKTLELTASTAGEHGLINASASVPLKAGPPRQIVIDPESNVLLGDGRSTVQLRVRAFDAFGNPVDADGSNAAVGSGSPAELLRFDPLPDIGGRVAVLRSQRNRTDSDATLEVSLGEARGAGTIRVAGYRPMFTLTPRLGFASNVKDVNAPWLAVAAELWRSVGPLEVGLAVEGGRLSFGPAALSDGSLHPDGGTQYLSAFAGPTVGVPIGARWTAGVSLGAGTANVSDRLRLDGQPETVTSGWVLAGFAQGSVQLELWNGGPELTARVSRFGDPSLPTLSGQLTAFSGSLGYRFELR